MAKAGADGVGSAGIAMADVDSVRRLMMMCGGEGFGVFGIGGGVGIGVGAKVGMVETVAR